MGQIPPIETDLSHAVKIAKLAARKAGKYLVGKLGKARIKYQKASRDYMLDVDLKAEHIILDILHKNYPKYGILPEEAKGERADSPYYFHKYSILSEEPEGDSPYYWIVDPLDGSANFQHSSSMFAVSIALVIHHITVVGVIYLPVRDEMFTAIRGQGATLNGKPIFHSEIGRVDEAIVHVGEFERHGNEVNREQIRELTIVADNASRIRIFGTSCADLVWVACGRADAFIMHGGHPWDVKAGRVILEEVGGKISSRKYDNGGILTIYTNGLIHQELSNLLGIDVELPNDGSQK